MTSYLTKYTLCTVERCLILPPRYIFFKFPIKMHNWFPTHREKQTLFHRLLRLKIKALHRFYFFKL